MNTPEMTNSSFHHDRERAGILAKHYAIIREMLQLSKNVPLTYFELFCPTEKVSVDCHTTSKE